MKSTKRKLRATDRTLHPLVEEVPRAVKIYLDGLDASVDGRGWDKYHQEAQDFVFRAVNVHAEMLAIVKSIYADEDDITRRKHSDEMRFRLEEVIAKAEGL